MLLAEPILVTVANGTGVVVVVVVLVAEGSLEAKLPTIWTDGKASQK